MWLKIFRRNKSQETVEEEIEIDPTAEAEIIQEKTIEITIEAIEMVVGTTTEIEVEIVETIAEIEIDEEVETDLIQGREEEINLDLDQDKDTLIKVRLVVSAIEVDTLLTTALDWRDI